MRTKQIGFSLIELLIVVAVILVIAAIAIPNLLRARMAANESSAVASLRSINTSEVVYQSSYGPSFAGASKRTHSDFFLPDRFCAGQRNQERLHLSVHSCLRRRGRCQL